VLIQGNTVTVPDSGVALVRGVSFAGSTADITIEDNDIDGVDVGVSHSGDVVDGGSLCIVDNRITCATDIRIDSWSGGSTGVWIFLYVAAHFDNIDVEGNNVEAVGGWVSLIDYASLYSDPPPFVDSLTVVGNVLGPDEGSARNVSSDGASSVTITANVPEWVNL
jgi:hypothetical protein